MSDLLKRNHKDRVQDYLSQMEETMEGLPENQSQVDFVANSRMQTAQASEMESRKTRIRSEIAYVQRKQMNSTLSS